MSTSASEKPTSVSRTASAPSRLFSLDVFRGATIAAMILDAPAFARYRKPHG